MHRLLFRILQVFTVCFLTYGFVLISVQTPAAAADSEVPHPALLELQEAVSKLFPNHKLEIRHLGENKSYVLIDELADIGPVRIELKLSEKPNAFAIPAYRSKSGAAQIILTTALKNLLINKSELAFVIAHELAHLREDHFSPDLPAITLTSSQLEKIVRVHQGWEMTADKEAVEMLYRRGLDARAGLHLLGRLDQFETKDKLAAERSHPAISERLNRLNSQIAQILP